MTVFWVFKVLTQAYGNAHKTQSQTYLKINFTQFYTEAIYWIQGTVMPFLKYLAAFSSAELSLILET